MLKRCGSDEAAKAGGRTEEIGDQYRLRALCRRGSVAVLALGECTRQMLNDPMAQAEVQQPAVIETVGKAVLNALKLLHGAGFVHMDVKPSNIIKVRENLVEKWKLFDLDTSCKKRKPVGGFTHNYAAPELARASLTGGETPLADPKMDVWATGLVLLEMATLRPLVKPPAEGSDGNSAALEELAKEADDLQAGCRSSSRAQDGEPRPAPRAPRRRDAAAAAGDAECGPESAPLGGRVARKELLQPPVDHDCARSDHQGARQGDRGGRRGGQEGGEAAALPRPLAGAAAGAPLPAGQRRARRALLVLYPQAQGRRRRWWSLSLKQQMVLTPSTLIGGEAAGGAERLRHWAAQGVHPPAPQARQAGVLVL